jgi:pimeloyl-ACP methyl ester carboxylesterase
VRIFCRVQRKARRPWLVFLHGGGGSLSAWYNQEAFFSGKNYSLLLIDMRGHGMSEKGATREFFDLRNFVRDVKAVLGYFGIKKATIIGHCFGSIVAQQFCADYTRMVEHLVLINSAKEPFKVKWRKIVTLIFSAFVYRLPFKGVKGHVEYSKYVGGYDIHIPRFLADVRCAGRLTCSNTYRITANFKSPIKRFPKPVLLIYGKSDILIPCKNSLDLRYLFINPVVKLLDTNHLSVYNDGPGVSRAIFEFLESSERGIGKGWKSRT